MSGPLIISTCVWSAGVHLRRAAQVQNQLPQHYLLFLFWVRKYVPFVIHGVCVFITIFLSHTAKAQARQFLIYVICFYGILITTNTSLMIFFACLFVFDVVVCLFVYLFVCLFGWVCEKTQGENTERILFVTGSSDND